ncbi:MAG: TIGR02996 domain-containing protein [Labilithrix sp.]
MSLRDALHHLQNTHPEPALEALLDAWRASKRHPAIADAIELLSATLTAKETPIRATGGTSARAAWGEAASSKRAAVMGRLLEAISDSTDRHLQIDVLLAMPADPRMATAAKKWLESPPVRATSRAPFFHRVVRLIERTGDVRLAPFLVALTEPRNQSAANRAYGVQTWRPLVAAAAQLAKRKVPDLDRDDTLTLAAIAKLVRAPKPSAGTAADEEALFTRIYDDPTDDEARAVLADLLQQRGDPRGELIAMQLARHGTDTEPSPAEKKLIQQWGRVWLGPLEPALQKQGVVFERGFVARGRYVRGAAGAKSIGAREWSTLTHLDVSAKSAWDDSAPDLLWSDAARNLRHVTGVNPVEDLARLRNRGQPMPWLSVGFVTSHWVYCASLEEGPQAVFPAARKLSVRAESDDNFFVNADEILALLERWPAIVDFEIDAEPELVLGIRSDARGKQLERLVLDGPMGVLTLEGDRLDFQPRSREDPRSFLEVVVERLEVHHVNVTAAS